MTSVSTAITNGGRIDAATGRCSISQRRRCLLFWAVLMSQCMFSVLLTSAEETVVSDSTKKMNRDNFRPT